MNLYFDLETVPTENEVVIQRLADKVKAPGNYKKQETIDKWMEENFESETLAGVAKTSLSGTFGQILTIGFAFDDDPVRVVGRDLKGSEGSVLGAFFEAIRRYKADRRHKPIKWIGHNIHKFDLRFMMQRAIVNGVGHGDVYIPCDLPAYHESIYDTMFKWAGFGGTVSLDNLCLALGIDTPKDNMHGSDVWQYAKDGRINEIEEYCMGDVSAVREVYKKMNFIGVES